MEFNKLHNVAQVMKKIVLSDELQTKKPSEIDLRFFSQIEFGDTYNGTPNPYNGITYRGILYGNQIVHAWIKRYDDGAGAGSWDEGNRLFVTMYQVACAYLKIVDIAQRQYCKENLPDNMTREERKEADRVSIDASILRILKKHPQYLDLVEPMGLRLLRVRGTSKFSVKVSKHYQR